MVTVNDDRELIKDALRRAISNLDVEIAYHAAMKLAEMLAEDREAAKNAAITEMARQMAEIKNTGENHWRLNDPDKQRIVPL